MIKKGKIISLNFSLRKLIFYVIIYFYYKLDWCLHLGKEVIFESNGFSLYYLFKFNIRN